MGFFFESKPQQKRSEDSVQAGEKTRICDLGVENPHLLQGGGGE